MIYFITPLTDDKNFDKFLGPSLKKLKNSDYHLTRVYGKQDIFQKYNQGLNELKPRLKSDDVVVFLHEDITILDEFFIKKIQMYFQHKTKVGIAGVIGTTKYSEHGGWWMVDRTVHGRGSIMQGHPGGAPHMMTDRKGNFDDLVSVDGCILFMKSDLAKRFQFENTAIDGFHFYDSDSCFKALRMGFDVGTIDVLVQHESEGPMPESWNTNKDKFIKKWSDLGFKFPITKEQF